MDKAAPMHRELLNTQIRVLGPEHPDTLRTINNLARISLQELGKDEEAAGLRREAAALGGTR